jgi:hypothetical protein
MSNEAKCNCRHCNGHIAFPAEMVGQSINCPHCQLETLLFIPSVAPVPKHPATPAKVSKPKAPGTVALSVIFCVYAFMFVLTFRQWREDEITDALSGLGSSPQSHLGPVLLWLLISGFVGGSVGFLVGKVRGKQRLGAAWGIALGPVGWLITLCSSDLRQRCPECRGVLVDAARRCKHCGVVLGESREEVAQAGDTASRR